MAKVVWKTTPKAAYEWVELEGGGSMSHAEQVAYLDEYIEANGLVAVETTFDGEVPRHRYGRYKAAGAPAAALAPTALPGREGDLTSANAEIDRLKAELARALDQAGKREAQGKGAEVIEGSAVGGIPSAAGGQPVEEARAILNQQEGVDLVGSGEEVREDMSTADRSDDNPKRGPGRPRKG